MLLKKVLMYKSTLAHFIPPPVLPAHAPTNISTNSIAFENDGHKLKSVVAKPVEVIRLAT